MKKSLFILLLFFSISSVFGQGIQSLRLPHDYRRDDLDKVIAAIGEDLDIRFVYDKEYLSKYKVSFMPNLYASSDRDHRESTVGDVLRTLRNSWDMATEVGDDGYIYIAKDKNQLKELKNRILSTTQTQIEEVVTERGSMTPIKRNFTLSGEVMDVKNGERIPYATICIDGTTTGTISDANGRFTLDKIPSDTCTLTIAYIGYLPQKLYLTPSTENKSERVYIEQQPLSIAEVFVVGRKNDKALQQYTGEHKMKMAPESLKLLPNMGEKDIMRGFQLMPGVSASNENSSGMYVRGGTPDQNLILYDGFTIYYVDHLHGFYSAFNSNAIKDVQLYKGGFESKYGGRLSSVTEITAKDGSNQFTVGGEISLLSMNVYTEIPIGDKVTSLFAFRRSYQGYMWDKISGQTSSDDEVVFVPQGPNGESSSQSSSPAYFFDLNAKITYTPTDDDILSLSIFNGTDYTDNTPDFSFGGGGPGGGSEITGVTMDNSDYSNYGNFGTSLRWNRKINSKWSSNLLGSFSNFYATRDQTRSLTVTTDSSTETTESGTIEENMLYDFSLKNDWKYQLNNQHTIELGAFGTYYDISYSYSINEDEKLLDKYNSALLMGVYAQDKISFMDSRLVFTPGMRINYFTSNNKVYFEPRLAASYKLNNEITVNGATGIFNQYANRIVREDILSGNTDFWILSDGETIPVSQSKHFNLGVNYDLPEYLFSVEGYYKLNYDITEYNLRYESDSSMPGQSSTSESQVSESFYVGDGYATGIEFLAQKKSGNLSGWVSYTLGQVKNCFPAQSDQYYFASQDVTHELKMVGIYRFGNFDFSATWIYSTGRPYTAPLGAYEIEGAGGNTETYFAVSDRNTFRLPDYHRLDLAASYRFDIFGTKGRPNMIGVSLFNAYNRQNVSAKQFEIVDDTILESNINYLSITPNVSLSFKF